MKISQLIMERLESISLALEKYKNQKDIYISYTDVPKLGIYPGSGHDETPLGIYCYPLKEMYRQVVNDTIPYAGDRPYVVVIQITSEAKIMYIGNYPETQFHKDAKKLKEILSKIFDKDQADELIKLYPYPSSTSIWNITQYAARLWSEKGGPLSQVGWNKLFRSLGYTGVVDRHGSGLIHEVERTQAVFFSTVGIKLIEILPNTKKKPFVKLIGNETTAELLRIIKKSPSTIVSIKNPSPQMLLTALHRDPSLLKSLKDIPEHVKLAVVEKDGSAIRYIVNPSESLQLAAVQNNNWKVGDSIKYIDNPSEKVQEASVINDPLSFPSIKTPSEKVKRLAVKLAGNNLQYIKNPSEDLKLEALKSNGMAIRFINKPSDEMKLIAVKNWAASIQYIDNPTAEMLAIARAKNIHI